MRARILKGDSVVETWDTLNVEVVACRACPRLVAWREEVACTKRRAYRDWDYWGRPVPGFGDRNARIAIVGLAPGAHGSNRTGRMVTGDSSGETLYGALHRAGFANQPTWERADDGLLLSDVFITAVGRCAPPGNKPTREELLNCRPYLERELALLTNVRVIVALGRIAFEQLRALWCAQGYDIPPLAFTHGADYAPAPALPALLASYHPSRQNTQTGRLTSAMFDAVWERAQTLLEQ